MAIDGKSKEKVWNCGVHVLVWQDTRAAFATSVVSIESQRRGYGTLVFLY